MIKENTIIDNSTSNTMYTDAELKKLTVVKLKSVAKKLKIKGYYKMRKAELIISILLMYLDKKG